MDLWGVGGRIRSPCRVSPVEATGGQLMRDLTSLRREAERLREKAGMPIQRETLATLEPKALTLLIEDARSAIRAKAEQAEFQRALLDLIPED